MKIILASKSPRRKEILENLGISFKIITADTDESSDTVSPRELVSELSLKKGLAVARLISTDRDICPHNESVYVISSDTVVAMGNEILGKPKDRSDAERMLKMLSGNVHSVFSGIAVTEISNGKIVKSFASAEETSVVFSKMSDRDIDFYIENENIYDKAGAYAIQGIASAWIDRIEGDYNNVVGLPVRCMFKLFLEKFFVTPYDLLGSSEK